MLRKDKSVLTPSFKYPSNVIQNRHVLYCSSSQTLPYPLLVSHEGSPHPPTFIHLHYLLQSYMILVYLIAFGSSGKQLLLKYDIYGTRRRSVTNSFLSSDRLWSYPGRLVLHATPLQPQNLLQAQAGSWQIHNAFQAPQRWLTMFQH